MAGYACSLLTFPFWGGFEPKPGGGGTPNPTTPLTTAQPTDDPCDSNQNTAAMQGDLGQIAKTVGGKLSDNWEIHVRGRLSVDRAVERLTNAGFQTFTSLNLGHPGVNLQGQLNGRWYHVTVTPFSSPNAAVNSNERRDSGPNSARNSVGDRRTKRVRQVTAHCEKNKLDSVSHLMDYLWSLF